MVISYPVSGLKKNAAPQPCSCQIENLLVRIWCLSVFCKNRPTRCFMFRRQLTHLFSIICTTILGRILEPLAMIKIQL